MRILILRLLFLADGGQPGERAGGRRCASRATRYRAVGGANLREAEAAVRRSERLAALGQLSAGLAHELRNPLGTIKASAEMLARNVPSRE